MANRRTDPVLMTSVLLATFYAHSASAQEAYPTKPVRVIAPFPPGGTTDVLTRIVSQKLGDAFGRSFVVENRPGAGSNIGHEAAAKSAADGYTLVMSSNTALVANPFLYKRLGFDPQGDFAPVSLVGRAGPVLVVHPSVPARSVKELIGLARARPGALSFGSGGRGTPAHIAGEILKAAEKLDIVHVPYKGGILAVTDLVSGQIEMVFADMVPSVPHIKTGKLRPLAVTSAQRSPALPEVPTLAEAGVPMLVPDTWWALLAPRGTAPGIVQRLNSEIAQIMRQNDIRERYAVLGVNPAHTSPEGVYELVRKEAPVFGAAFKAAGVKPE